MDNRDLEDWEYPEPDSESETDTEVETIACAACGREIYEESVRCPYCGHYVTQNDAAGLTGRPWWFVIMAIAALIATAMWLVF